MTPSIQRWDQHRHMPWANGAGSTAEIARSPFPSALPDSDSVAFDWRLSIADVTGDGPFSRFAGIDRTIVNLGDVRMTLQVNGVRHTLSRFVPFSFPGDAETWCEVSGPTRDLNLMTRRGRATGSLDVCRVDEPLVVPADRWLIVVDGALPVGDSVLGFGDALWVASSLDLNPCPATIALVAVS